MVLGSFFYKSTPELWLLSLSKQSKGMESSQMMHSSTTSPNDVQSGGRSE